MTTWLVLALLAPATASGPRIRIQFTEPAVAEPSEVDCQDLSFGPKRDIGTGARVSGHTHYDRIEFDCTAEVPEGLKKAVDEGTPLTAKVEVSAGGDTVRVSGEGHSDGGSVRGSKVVGSFVFHVALDGDGVKKAERLSGVAK